jgi:NADPH-dependent 2,4-dienoyl-CoA reductase/sulfur reductase-like enzyme
MATTSAPLDPDGTVVVVGASLAGLRAAEEIRHEGHRGPVVVVGAEVHAPYDRPPLSKQFLSGAWDVLRIHHHAPDALDTLGLDFRLGRRVVLVDPEARMVELDDGTIERWDGLVVATGTAPRTLPGTVGMAGVHPLRTLDDALAIRDRRDDLGEAARVVVVGAGFIGAEVAATCRGRGAAVTMVEPMPTPLGRVLGARMGEAVTALHREQGVDVRTGVGVGSVSAGSEGSVRVTLADGSELPADLVVVGIGVVPATGWLEGTDLDLEDGVRCSETLFAAERIVAAGDVARWDHPGSGGPVRLEHWTNAAEGGAHAARNLLAGSAAAEPYDPVPFFWSDQYRTKIQMLGVPAPEDEVVVVEGDTSGGPLVALYRRGDRLGAVLAFSRPRQLMGYRPLVAAGAPFVEAVAHARS